MILCTLTLVSADATGGDAVASACGFGSACGWRLCEPEPNTRADGSALRRFGSLCPPFFVLCVLCSPSGKWSQTF